MADACAVADAVAVGAVATVASVDAGVGPNEVFFPPGPLLQPVRAITPAAVTSVLPTHRALQDMPKLLKEHRPELVQERLSGTGTPRSYRRLVV